MGRSRARSVSCVQSAQWIAKTWNLSSKTEGRLKKDAWVFEWDPREYPIKEKHGVGPTLGVIKKISGDEIDIAWGDGEQESLPRKNVRLAPQRNEVFCEGNKTYRVLQILQTGAMVSTTDLPSQKNRLKAPAVGGVRKNISEKKKTVKKKDRKKTNATTVQENVSKKKNATTVQENVSKKEDSNEEKGGGEKEGESVCEGAQAVALTVKETSSGGEDTTSSEQVTRVLAFLNVCTCVLQVVYLRFIYVYLRFICVYLRFTYTERTEL